MLITSWSLRAKGRFLMQHWSAVVDIQDTSSSKVNRMTSLCFYFMTGHCFLMVSHYCLLWNRLEIR